MSEQVFEMWSVVERRCEVDNLRRSIAMLAPGVSALSREDALRLLEELIDVQERLERLKAGPRGLLDAAGPAQ